MVNDSDSNHTEDEEITQDQRDPRRTSIIEAPNAKKLKFYSIATFISLYLLYATFHAVRTSWSYMKKSITTETGYDSTTQSLFDSCFLMAYAAGLYLSGYIGDRINLKVFLFGGTCVVLSGYLLFAVFEGIWKIRVVPLDVLAFIINGIGQSTGWPGCIHILSNWVDKKQRGFLIGLWASNLNIGDIFGQQIGALVTEETTMGWVWGYIIVGATLGSCLLLLGVFVKAKPDDLVEIDNKLKTKGSFKEQKEVYNLALKEHGHRASVHERGIGFFEAWMIPGVFRFAMIYLCVKGTVYGCMFWLPKYLQNQIHFGDDTASILAVFEIGQLIGVVALGYFTDKLNNRSIIVTLSMSIGSIFFFLTGFLTSTEDKTGFMIYLFFAGLCIGGPSGLIAGAVAADLSQNKALKGNVSAMSTVTGIIEGTGTVGGSIVQMIVPIIINHCFFFYAGAVFVAAALLAPVAYGDYTKRKAEKVEIMTSLVKK